MADLSVLNAFQRQLEGSGAWPPPGERKLRRSLREYQALRETDREELRRMSAWEEGRKYVVDPLAERIPGAFADLIFGEAPSFEAANSNDQDHLDEMIAANMLADELQGGAGLSSSEGSAWWRIIADRSLPYPTISWVGRASVVPNYSGRQLRAVAFVEDLQRPAFEDDESKCRWRYVEIQVRGMTRNLLYRAEDEKDGLGKPRPLTDHWYTEDLAEEWNHGLDLILAGEVLNVSGAKRAAVKGRSDYHGVRDLLLELNEIASTGAENRKLTAKKRVVVPQRYLTESGEFPEGVDVLIASESDQDPDKPDQGLVQVEWSFDARPLIEWKEDVEATALTRARVAPQLVGRATESAQTGPAFRARLYDSLLAAGGKAQAWDLAVPQALLAAPLVDQLPEEKGGFGHTWSEAGAKPSMERGSSLPVDETEEANRVAAEVGAEILSRQTAIEERHPDWEPVRVEEELERITRFSPTVGPAEDPFAPPPSPES